MTLQAQFLVSGHIAKLILYLIIIRVAPHVTDKTVSFQSGLPLAHHIWPYDTKAAMVMVKTFRLRLHCGSLQSLQIILCHSHVCVWIWNRKIIHSLKRPVVMPRQPLVARERWVVPHWPRNAWKCEFESLSSYWTSLSLYEWGFKYCEMEARQNMFVSFCIHSLFNPRLMVFDISLSKEICPNRLALGMF